MGNASEKFFGFYDTAMQETSAAQEQALAEGQEKLFGAVGEYNQSVDSHEAEVKAAAMKMINLQLEADREAAEKQLQEIVDALEADVSGNDPGSGDGEGEKDPEVQYEIILSATGDEEAINSIVEETLALFKMEPEAEEIDSVIRTYFVDALSEENTRQKTKLTEEMETVKESMEAYEKRLGEFDPMGYIENANLSASLNGIDANAREMLRAVEQSNAEYMLYASEMYANTTEHTTQVRSALDEANTQTVKNVADCMNDLAFSRAQVNNQNVDLLKGFTESLAYTKVGSRENTEVYDYIINPVVPRINGQAVTEEDAEMTADRPEYSIKTWLAVILGAAILFCTAGILSALRQRNEEQTEESEETI